MKTIPTASLFALFFVPLAATAADTPPAHTDAPGASATQISRANSQSNTVYIARLHSMNTKVTGLQTVGEAKFVTRGNTLTISVEVKAAPPGITHWQHFHGFKDNHAATCPTEAADMNGDGIIDLIETEPMSGTTMVPFDDVPVAMDVAHGAYPKASAAGTYMYRKPVSLKGLTAAFAKVIDDRKLDLDHRVVFIHGVSPDAKLPPSVASLGDIPAQITLPIACGEIERVGR